MTGIIFLGITSGLFGGSTIQGFYMMLNQFQLIVLFLFTKASIHSDVRYFIQKHSFTLFNFEFLAFFIPSFFKDILVLFTSYPQSNKAMREIDFASGSTLENNIILVGVITTFILVNSAIILIPKITTSSRGIIQAEVIDEEGGEQEETQERNGEKKEIFKRWLKQLK